MIGKCSICDMRRTIHIHQWTKYKKPICYQCASKFKIGENKLATVKQVRILRMVEIALSEVMR